MKRRAARAARPHPRVASTKPHAHAPAPMSPPTHTARIAKREPRLALEGRPAPIEPVAPPLPHASAPSRTLVLALSALALTAAALRVLCCLQYSFVHADEYHQYLNPAWWRLTGGGMEAWEWREGARSWVLPFYHGAFMHLLMTLGVKSGAALVWFFRAHWGLVNGAALAYLAWRSGSALGRQLDGPSAVALKAPGDAATLSGILAATLCTLCVPMVIYSGHALTDVPSALLLLWGLCATHALIHATPQQATRRVAVVAGLVTSLAVCLRVANAPLALVAPAWLLIAGRVRALGPLCLAALLPPLVFSLIDWVTWGTFGQSFWVYLRFNLIEGRAADFGSEPAGWYLRTLLARAPWTLPVVLALGLVALRATWPLLGCAALAVGYLSTQAHKEERFILLVWPLLLIAAAVGFSHALVRLRTRMRDTQRPLGRLPLGVALVAALVAAFALDSWRHRQPVDIEGNTIMRCERWVGDQPDVTGLLYSPLWWHGGGAIWHALRVPVLPIARVIPANPLFNYAIIPTRHALDMSSKAAGFRTVHVCGRFHVRKRDAPSEVASR